ncbi:MAG TPA: hypothetical protein PLL78_04110 [Fimbriimonadaceae bacterium]|nr:hypothetical protein [Fimbriimonadaceae bacterium]HRJ95846.1 hypothetical protein [Fimbriimonadaceae bacterium]
MKALCLAALSALAVGSHAFVVPNYATASEADGAFFLTATATAGRTYQVTISATQLTGLVGRTLTGMRWRMNGGIAAAWPPADVTYANWDIFIGPGVAPSTMSNTFALNFSAAATQVRTGPVAFTAGAFTVGGTPNAFGPAIMFDTGYLYSGGDLTIEMRFTNQVGTTTTPSFDAATAAGGPANGWGVDFAGRWIGNLAGTTGGNANFLATYFESSAANPTISGTVDLQDWTATLAGQMVRFEITAAGGGPVLQTTDTALDGTGAYSFGTSLSPGLYDIYAKGSHWLRRASFGVTLTGSGVSGLGYSLFNGDCDEDNEVAIGDYSLLSTAFGSSPGDPNWDPMTDLNGDDEVTIGDYAILSGNFGMIGD